MNNIRNFCIIAHIDHGKSTLADRFLEMTGTVEKRKIKEQMMDTMDLEQERGITIKLQPASMDYKLQATSYKLNLIDTPGHVDFGYEVSRSLAAVEGAILLVDATQGVQAQTLANLYQAVEQGLEIVPVLNKIDLPNADIERTKKEIIHILGCKEDEIICVSGKTGQGVDELLKRVVKKIPAPNSPLEEEYTNSKFQNEFVEAENILPLQDGKVKRKEHKISPNPSLQRGELEENIPLRALIFDSKYDSYKGVLAYVRIVDGKVRAEDDIWLMMGKKEAHVIEVGKFSPQLVKKDILEAGDIGYIATGLKSVEQCKVGDTITLVGNFKFQIPNSKQITNSKLQISKEEDDKSRNKDQRISNSLEPLPGYKEVKPMVYASFYPTEGEDYNQFRDALDKLKLNDASITFEGESSIALGRGFRIGFLGLLHLEIIKERLQREFGFEPVITTPSVVYKILKTDNSIQDIFAAAEVSEANMIKEIQEPFVKLDIITPSQYMGAIMDLIQTTTRAEYLSTEYLEQDRIVLSFNAPLSEVIINLHDGVQSATSGFASFSYEFKEYRASDLVRMDIYIAEDKIEAFSQVIPRMNIEKEGRRIVAKLRDVIPRQNFLVKLQAAVGGKIVARESIQAFRKDVTGHLYGGDITRKRKLLEKQKKGKKKMKSSGKVEIPQKAFLEVLKK